MKWISVEDALPKSAVLIIYFDAADNEISAGRYSSCEKRFVDVNDYHLSNVTHWMPLPEPPENNSEQE